MTLSTVLIIIGLTLLLSHSCTSVTTGVNWEIANEHCKTQIDSLVDIRDLQNHLSYFKGIQSIWSSVKGHYTPWIAYRGCFHDDNLCLPSTKGYLTTTTCHNLNSNTAGNCFFECKSKNNTNGGCVDNVHFLYGLMGTICLCMCNYNLMQTLSESSKCNDMCRGSISNGECGGLNSFSVYESTTVVLPDAHFRGFCLTCRSKSLYDNTMLYSRDCNANTAGYCIRRNGYLSLQPWKSTFDIYWRYCKSKNLYIVYDTSQICHHNESSIWTGLRKYKIDNSDDDNESCYIIEIQNETANYNKRKCTEHHFFFCKQEIGPKNYSMEYIKSTKNIPRTPVTSKSTWTSKTTFSYTGLFTKDNTTSHSIVITEANSLKSMRNEATLAGASIAGILASTFVILLVVCLLKRRKFQRFQAEQQAHRQQEMNNTTYDDLVVTNQTQDDSNTYTTLSYDNQANR